MHIRTMDRLTIKRLKISKALRIMTSNNYKFIRDMKKTETVKQNNRIMNYQFLFRFFFIMLSTFHFQTFLASAFRQHILIIPLTSSCIPRTIAETALESPGFQKPNSSNQESTITLTINSSSVHQHNMRQNLHKQVKLVWTGTPPSQGGPMATYTPCVWATPQGMVASMLGISMESSTDPRDF